MSEGPFTTDDPVTALEAMAIAMGIRFMELDQGRKGAAKTWRGSVDEMSHDFGLLAETALAALLDWTRKAVAHGPDLLFAEALRAHAKASTEQTKPPP